MRRLLFEGPATVRWEEAETPTLSGPGAALVAPLAVATCDLDVAALKGIFPLAGPYRFGHEAVAEVTAVGDEVATVKPGDRVVVPFQVSCGECAPCRRGRTGNCASHPRLPTYGLGTMGGLQWGGLLADVALVPHADAILVPVPGEVDPVAVASTSDNLPDAWRCVGPQLDAEPGADVLVVGGDGGPSSIGLYAAGATYQRRQVQVAVRVDTVEISNGNELVRSHTVRHDGTREHAALATPGGRPTIKVA